MLLILLLFVIPDQLVFASEPPVIFYTDITSGPNSGGEDNLGCYLTINGKRFGSFRGTSTVSIGGGEVTRYIVWSDDKIAVQLGSSAVTGDITVNTSEGSANAPEDFTVRPGNFYFIAVDGIDETGVVNDITHPYRSTWYVQNLVGFGAGDFIVVRGGTYNLLTLRAAGKLNYDRWLSISVENQIGTANNEITVYGYPGETPIVWWGDTASGYDMYGVKANQPDGDYWNICNITFDLDEYGGPYAMQLGFHNLEEQLEHARLVNITVRGGMGALNGTNLMTLHKVDYLKMYGLDIGEQSSLTPSNNESHMVYLKQQYTNADIGWCYLHDNKYGRAAMQIYGDQASDENNINVRVHDCRFENLPLEAVIMGIGSKEVYFYNNIINNVQTRKVPGFSAIHVQGAHLYNEPSGEYYLYNNVFYSDTESVGIIKLGYQAATLLPNHITMHNNIFHPITNTTEYYFIASTYLDPATDFTFDNNAWYNSTQPVPAWAGTNAVITDPKFVDKNNGNFHLQPDSPIKDSGKTISYITRDADGFLIPQGDGYSIGAYEVLAAEKTISPPANLMVW